MTHNPWVTAQYNVFDQLPPEVKRALHESIFVIPIDYPWMRCASHHEMLEFIEEINQYAMQGALRRGVPAHSRLRANW